LGGYGLADHFNSASEKVMHGEALADMHVLDMAHCTRDFIVDIHQTKVTQERMC
jgi:hypothetical protein